MVSIAFCYNSLSGWRFVRCKRIHLYSNCVILASLFWNLWSKSTSVIGIRYLPSHFEPLVPCSMFWTYHVFSQWFFYSGFACVLLASIFLIRKSSVSVSFLNLCCLNLSWLPASSWKVLCFIDSLLLSMMLCHRKQCSVSLYSKGRALYRERMIQRFTFCFNFMPYICHNVTLSFLKKTLDVMLIAQHSLVWIKALGKAQELKQN